MTVWEDHLYHRSWGAINELEHLGRAFLNPAEEVVTFPLWDGTVWKGYHTYNWRLDKSEGRYFTYKRKQTQAMFGTFSLGKEGPLFITEGVFESLAVQSLGFSSVAVLSNSTLPIKNFLFSQGKRTVALIQPDKASEELRKGCQSWVYLSKDADDYSRDSLLEILREA